MRRSADRVVTASLLVLLTISGRAQQSALQQGFTTPPQSARPMVWWHWMNGNITKEGIELDLQWMHRIGLGGFQVFEGSLGTPQIVPKRIVYMTPEWKDAFRFATTTANRLNLSEGIACSPGWSETGGPWVEGSEGMKKYVWSETDVEGGKPFSGKLTHPPETSGAFQTAPSRDVLKAPPGSKPIPTFYADSKVVAFRSPSDQQPLHPTITTSGSSDNPGMLSDGDLTTPFELNFPEPGQKAWIQYDFGQPTAIRSLSMSMRSVNRETAAVHNITPPQQALEASTDGKTFRPVAAIPTGNDPSYSLTFPATTARYFRITFKRQANTPHPPFLGGVDPTKMGMHPAPAPTTYRITEAVLYPDARVNAFEQKAAFTAATDLYSKATMSVDPGSIIAQSDVVDLTGKMKPDGTLDWTPPPGHWVILRFGYSLLGITNHPAPPEATGLEVDKLNRNDVRKYLTTYLDNYEKTVGPELLGKHGISNVVNDSWEAGSQNWTDDMIQQFQHLRGYDPVPWMPVLAGHIVKSPEASDAFLWDFRRTIGDLIADEHYGELATMLRARGLVHYGEAHETGRAFVADGMQVKKLDDVPMGAMWVHAIGMNGGDFSYNADDRESSSVAHVYGQNLAAAESFTSGAAYWQWSPATLRPTADQEFLNGINRIVIHETTLQPLVDHKPGLTLGRAGQFFNRNETWANQAKPWIDYLARSSYMLQQGHFVADVLYYYGEDSDITALFNHSAPPVPSGYNFDYINPDGLMHALHVEDGRIRSVGGMSYRVIALDPNSKHMSLPVLQALAKLVSDGAVVVGSKPINDPSLADDPAAFQKLADELFGNGTGQHTIGKGTVYAGASIADALSGSHVPQDFEVLKPAATAHLAFLHRATSDSEIYFTDNRSNAALDTVVGYRVTGMTPEVWDADTGKVSPVSFNLADGRTNVSLHLDPWQSVFVVFRKSGQNSPITLPRTVRTQLVRVDGPWQLSFPPEEGAPASLTLDHLVSWDKSSNPNVRYFSGTATYTKTVKLPDTPLPNNAQLWLDLGQVDNLAEVSINGKPLGITWHEPYRVDATGALRPGTNTLTIKVTNAWANRLIGDEQPGAKQYTWADIHPYKADSPLVPSGLLGPVTIEEVTTKQDSE